MTFGIFGLTVRSCRLAPKLWRASILERSTFVIRFTFGLALHVKMSVHVASHLDVLISQAITQVFVFKTNKK